MTLPDEPWCWPAFWLWGAPWPPELDVVECYGKKKGGVRTQEINVHYGNKQNIGGRKISLGKNKGQFHEFAVEWREDKIEFFTNGIKVFVMSDPDILEYFKQGMWLVVNNNVKNSVLSDKDYYSEFVVDYVRIFINW